MDSLSALLSKFATPTPQATPQTQQDQARHPPIDSSTNLKDLIASQSVLEYSASLSIPSTTAQNLIARWKNPDGKLRYAVKYLQTQQTRKQEDMLRRRRVILKRHEQQESDLECRRIIKRGTDKEEARERYVMSKEIQDFDLGLIKETSLLVEYQRRKLSGYGVKIGQATGSDEEIKNIILVLLKIQDQFT